MHGLFGILSMAVRPYTITHMVAGGVGDPPDDLNKRSKPLTRLEAIAPDGNDNFFFTDKITTEATLPVNVPHCLHALCVRASYLLFTIYTPYRSEHSS